MSEAAHELTHCPFWTTRDLLPCSPTGFGSDSTVSSVGVRIITDPAALGMQYIHQSSIEREMALVRITHETYALLLETRRVLYTMHHNPKRSSKRPVVNVSLSSRNNTE